MSSASHGPGRSASGTPQQMTPRMGSASPASAMDTEIRAPMMHTTGSPGFGGLILPTRASSVPPQTPTPASSRLLDGSRSVVGSPLSTNTVFPMTFAAVHPKPEHTNIPELTTANAITTSLSGAAGPIAATAGTDTPDADEAERVSAYARLDFESFTFYVQTLQVIIGRRAENGTGMVDVHLGPSKGISRRHAKIFYNFGSQRFELSVLGRNGAFVGDVFLYTGSTVPLSDGTTVQIGGIPFTFVLPQAKVEIPEPEAELDAVKPEPELLQAEVASKTASPEIDFQLHQIDQDRQAAQADFAAEVNAMAPLPDPYSHDDIPIAPELGGGATIITSKSFSNGGTSKRKVRREYLPEEIPPEYREKPPHSYSHLIATALRAQAPISGMSLADIYKAIQDIFPYYLYCPHGWQNSVRHNLSSNKAFKKVSKEGKGWLWGIDEEYFLEKEQQKKKAAAAKAKASAAMAASQQQNMYQYPQATSSSEMGVFQVNTSDQPGKREKSIAELAREIEVNRSADSHYRNYSELTRDSLQQVAPPSTGPTFSVKDQYRTGLDGASQAEPSPNSIRAQLAANLQQRQRTAVQPSLAAGQSTFRMNKQTGTSFQTPAVSQHPTLHQQTSIPQMRVQRQSPNVGQPEPKAPDNMAISPETVKALALLQQKIQKQIQSMGIGTGANSAMLTNALAMAIAQAVKTQGAANIASLLNGKNPAQLTQLLQTALATMKKKQAPAAAGPSTTSTGAASSPATPATPTTLQADSDGNATPDVAEPGQPVTTLEQELAAPIPVPAPVDLPTELTQPVDSAPSQSPQSAEALIPVSAPTPAPVTAPAVSAPPPSIPVPSQPSAAAALTALMKQPLTPTSIAQILAQADKISNPSPSVKAALDQLRAHAARLANKRPAESVEDNVAVKAAKSDPQPL